MRYHIKPHSVEEIEGKSHLIRYKGEDFCVKGLAVATDQSRPTIIKKIKMLLDGELKYDRLVSNISLSCKMVKVDRIWYTIDDICNATGWSKPKITERIVDYENEKITKEELFQEKQGQKKKNERYKPQTRNWHLLAGSKNTPGEEKSFFPKLNDQEEYIRQLRLHKLNTASIIGGC